MAKPKKYYYRCIYPVDMNYLAPDHRRERWEGLQAPIVIHTLRMYPEDKLAGKAPDYLVSERPLAKHYVEPIMRTIKRKNLRTGEYVMQETATKVKWELLEADEITEEVRRNARSLSMPEGCYATKEPVEA